MRLTTIVTLLSLMLLLLGAAAAEEEERKFPYHYEELGLSRNCTSAEIRRASRILLAKNHPDKRREVGAKERFMRINEANTILSDPLKRRKYDEELEYYEKYGYWALRYKKNAPPNSVILVILVTLLGSAWLQYLYLKNQREQQLSKFLSLPKNRKKADDRAFVQSVREELGLESRQALLKETFIVTMWSTIPRIFGEWWAQEKQENKKKGKGKSLATPSAASKAVYMRFFVGFMVIVALYWITTSLVVWRLGLNDPFMEVRRTGMRPLYVKGDLLLMEWGRAVREDLKVGDIVAYQVWVDDPITVHRIVELSREGAAVNADWHMITKGDALTRNDLERGMYPEETPYLTDEQCYGRIIWKLPPVAALLVRTFFFGELGPWLILFVLYWALAGYLAGRARSAASTARRLAALEKK